MHFPGCMPVKSHILLIGRHCEAVTVTQMMKKQTWKMIVPYARSRDLFEATMGHHVLANKRLVVGHR